jgi:hypothetical protein|tara:strand:- start:3711 stop:4028 length:318 start_codon:yes stop_codon:yes gene_type:complete
MKYLYVNGDSYPFGYELENSSNTTRGEGRFPQLISEKLNLKECNTSKPGTSFRRTFRQTIDYVITRPDMASESDFLEEEHPGPKTHKIIADCVLDYIINNNNGLL